MSNRAGLVLVAVLPIVFGAPRFSHADPTVLSICVNPGGAIRAVDPSEACPRNHTKVSVPLGAQAQLDFYTVARPAETHAHPSCLPPPLIPIALSPTARALARSDKVFWCSSARIRSTARFAPSRDKHSSAIERNLPTTSSVVRPRRCGS